MSCRPMQMWKLWLESLIFSTFRTVWFFFLGRYYPLIFYFFYIALDPTALANYDTSPIKAVLSPHK
jgi:hypothetical protein